MAENRRTGGWVPLGLAAIVLLGSVPYLSMGPGFFADDWYALRAARLDGWFDAAGGAQWRARPGAGVVYALTFGLIHDRPAVLFGIASVLVAAAAVLIYRIVRRFEAQAVAIAVALVWLAAPNHTSLEMWPSALNILGALVLTLAGVELLLSSRDRRRELVAVLVMTAGILCYEATAPLAAMSVLLVVMGRYRKDERPDARRLAIVAVGVFGPTALWMLLNWHPDKEGIDRWIDLGNLLPGHIGATVFGDGVIGRIVTVGILAVCAIEAAGRIIDAPWRNTRSLRLIGIGAGVIALGAIPFARYFYAPLGLGDRVTVISGIGGALVLVGAGLSVMSKSRPIGAVSVVVAVAVMLSTRWTMVERYAIAADDGRRVLEAVERRFPDPPSETLVFGPTPVLDHNVTAFFNVDWAVQWQYDTRDVDVRTTFDRSDWADADARFRFDLWELSDLPEPSAP